MSYIYISWWLLLSTFCRSVHYIRRTFHREGRKEDKGGKGKKEKRSRYGSINVRRSEFGLTHYKLKNMHGDWCAWCVWFDITFVFLLLLVFSLENMHGALGSLYWINSSHSSYFLAYTRQPSIVSSFIFRLQQYKFGVEFHFYFSSPI